MLHETTFLQEKAPTIPSLILIQSVNAMTARWVVVDDTSSDINYVGDSWFSDVGSLDAVGDNGAPFSSTSHRTNTSASLAFNFVGRP